MLSLPTVARSDLKQLTILTEEFPPYNYSDGKSAQGINSEQVKQLLNKVALEKQIEFLPWNRAYHIALNQANVLIFSLARLEFREKMFHWIGKLSDTQICAFSLKSASELNAVNTLDQMQQYRVATQRDSHTKQILANQGYRNYQNLLDAESVAHSIKLLNHQRVDFIIHSKEVFYYQLSNLGTDIKSLIQTNFCINTYPLYLAASLETPLATVKQLQAAFKQIKQP